MSNETSTEMVTVRPPDNNVRLGAINNPSACLSHTWKTKIVLAPDALQPFPDITIVPEPTTVVKMLAEPQSDEVFEVVIDPGVFYRVHLEWPLCPWCPCLRVFRVYTCAISCCEDMTREYEVCGCPLFLPNGTYRFELHTAELCIPYSSLDLEYDVTMWLERVDHDYLAAFNASRGGNGRCG